MGDDGLVIVEVMLFDRVGEWKLPSKATMW